MLKVYPYLAQANEKINLILKGEDVESELADTSKQDTSSVDLTEKTVSKIDTTTIDTTAQKKNLLLLDQLTEKHRFNKF